MANIVSVSTLKRLFQNHNEEYPGILCVVELIWCFAHIAIGRDFRNKRTVFKKWERDTLFHPKPSFTPSCRHWANTPVHEYTRYHEQLFIRRKHSIGVTFAAQTRMNDSIVFVVWTYTRKAYVFDSNLQLIKVLNRQTSPFNTWMRHLEGKEMHSSYGYSFADCQTLFSRSVVVRSLYGADPMLMSRSIRVTSHDHVIWGMIRKVSYMLSIPMLTRNAWHVLDDLKPYSGEF